MFGDVESNAARQDFLLSNPILQPHRPHSLDGGVREVTLGLDFGTSCVKCVVGDRTIKQAYAIPFFEGDGVDTYLLPSVLYEQNGELSLEPQTIAHHDLKLGFLGDINNPERQSLMVGFLALVIRQTLAWFLKEHRATYSSSQINWGLTVGLPAAPSLEMELSEQYSVFACAAWYVAWADGSVSKTVILDALKRAKKHTSDMVPQRADEDVEISTIPEIAAQIYGFVEATSFDPDERNIFLMVDAGAGTVDASLFQVSKGRANSWNFLFYTAEVGTYGVMNLHRKRLNWWMSALLERRANMNAQIKVLDDSKLATENNIKVPNRISEYFEPSTLIFNDEKINPDKDFEKGLRTQIIQAYQGAWKKKFLDQTDLRNVPAFLCGGGFRMDYYQFVETELKYTEGCSYLHAPRKVLEPPKNLVAHGVREGDYNRLSVAYGLSLIRTGKINKALPHVEVRPEPVTNWQENYIDKDQC